MAQVINNRVWESLLQEQAHRRRDKENQARQANCEIIEETFGAGEFTTPEPRMFPQPFISPPMMVSGIQLRTVPNRTWYTFPMVQVGVYDWAQNPRGFYLGARLFFNVQVETKEGRDPFDAPTLRCEIEHYLVFMGVAYKRLGSRVRDQVESDPTLLVNPVGTVESQVDA